MMRTILVVIAVAVMALFTGGPSAARESVCGPRAVILEQLRKSFSECPLFIGEAGPGQQVILTVSERGGWTFLAVDRNGLACVLAGGFRGSVAEGT